MNRIGCLGLVSLSLLGACAVRPTRAPDTQLPAAFDLPASVAADDIGLERWWSLYGDPQLEALVDEALRRAPDALAAQARLDEAQAVRGAALDHYNPQGGLTGAASRTQTSVLSGVGSFNFNGQTIPLVTTTPVDAYNADFNVSWELDLFGRRRAARHKANADLAAARFDYQASRTSLAANVADALFQARGLAIQLEDGRQSAQLQRELADIADAKLSRGLGDKADTDQAASLADQADAQVADLESQLHAARRTLLVLVGRGADPLDSLPTRAAVGAPPPVPSTVPGDLLARRPDVREAAALLKSAAGALKLDELALFPTFTLQPGVGLSSNVELGASTVTDFWSLGAGLAQPILDLPRLRSEIRAQGARVDQAAIAYQKAVQTAYGEAENALVGLAADEARVTLLSAGEARARSALSAAKLGYGAGVDDLATTLSAEQTWRSARTALTGAQIQALRRSVQVYKALGGGWAPPPAPLSKVHG